MSKYNDIYCPDCKSKMSLRNGKYGEFYGCSRFPDCQGTRRVRDVEMNDIDDVMNEDWDDAGYFLDIFDSDYD